MSVVPPPTLPPEDPDDADFRWVDRAKYHLYGTPGTEVTIRGRNFGPNLKVIFSGEEVPAKKVGGEEITFIVPKGKASGLIVLEGGGGRRKLVVGNFDTTKKWDVKARKKIAVEMKLRAEARWKERQAALAKTKEERRAAMEAKERELEQTRAERRRERVEALRGKWEHSFLASEEARFITGAYLPVSGGIQMP